MLSRDRILPHLIAARASASPEQTFLHVVGGEEMTYGELHHEALRWASALHGLGVSPGDRVATMLKKSCTPVAVWLGVAWARAIEVSMNLDYRGYMLRYVINHSGAEVLVVQDTYLDRLLELAGELPKLRVVIVVGDEADTGETPWTTIPAQALLESSQLGEFEGPVHSDIAMMLYTSGTTGPSKGVLIPWAQSHASATVWNYESDTVLYSPFPLFHVTGKTPIYAMALAGGRLVMRDRFSSSEFWNEIRSHDCNAANLMAAPILFLEGQPVRESDADNPLRFVTTGRLPMDPEAFMRRFALKIGTNFNMTEISPALASDGETLANNQSCGRVRPGYQCRVVDDHDEPLGPGDVGELVIRADTPWVLMAGYWNMPEQTVTAWRNQWFHTGDLFRHDEDGNFYYVDRLKDAIRRRGENISSFEVEAIVTEHPDVAECAAIAVARDSGDEVRIVVVLSSEATLSESDLCEYLIPNMPRYMVPRYVEFADSLPKTASLKVQKAVLREQGVTKRTWDREASGVVVPR